MTEEEMNLFSAAQVAAGYIVPERNRRGDGWLFERDHDRFVGRQLRCGQERERCALDLRRAAAKTAPQNFIANDNGYRAAEIYWDINVDVTCPYAMALRDEWMNGWNSYFEITGKVQVCRLLRPKG